MDQYGDGQFIYGDFSEIEITAAINGEKVNGWKLGPPESGGHDKIYGGDMIASQHLVGGPYNDKIMSGDNI